MSERIEKLRDLAERAYGCKATHVSSTPVTEVFEGRVIWEGVVETFDLRGFQLANRCYGFKFH